MWVIIEQMDKYQIFTIILYSQGAIFKSKDIIQQYLRTVAFLPNP